MILRRIAQLLRGDHRTTSFDLANCMVVGQIDADVIGFHWTLWVYGFPGRQICVAQGRSFSGEAAMTMLNAHTAARRWMLERSHTAPAGIKPEFNFRRWVCDFFQIP